MYVLYLIFLILSEEKQKSIDIESICQLLTLVLGSTFPAQVNSFVEYLKVSVGLYIILLFLLIILTCFLYLWQTQNDYKVINMDQWMGFFRFCNEVATFSTTSIVMITIKMKIFLNILSHKVFILFLTNLQTFIYSQISFPALNDYDPELAWPLILDNFVEWVREKQK